MARKAIHFIFGIIKKFLAAHRQRRLEKQKISQSCGFDFELKIKFKRKKD